MKLTVQRPETTTELLKTEVAASAGAFAAFFNTKIESFSQSMFSQCYVFALADVDAQHRMHSEMTEKKLKKIRVSMFEFFGLSYAQECVVYKAGEKGLPVALIKATLEQMVANLYSKGYYLGVFSEEKTLLVTDALHRGVIELDLKPVQVPKETHQTVAPEGAGEPHE